jgi:acyl-CoA synthetase (AMP-forming)/AMP-acid ligase II
LTSSVLRAPGGTLVELTRAAVQAFPDRDAYVELDRRITYARYDRSAQGAASLFAQLGVAKGDVVCLAIPTSIDYAVAYQAALRLGAITSGINTRLGPVEKQGIIERLMPTVTVVDTSTVPPAGPVGQVVSLEELTASYDHPADYQVPDLLPSDPVTIVWTSGTTGVPKGALFDHSRLEAMASGGWPLTMPGDRRLFPVPFAHTGYMTRLWDEIANGITSVLTPADWTAQTALHLIDREAVTVGQGVPTQWALMLRHDDFDRTDFSSMRIAGVGAAAISPQLVRDIRSRIGCPVVVRYTSTEASITTTTSPDDSPEVVTQTVGHPIPGVEIELVGEDGEVVATGQVGQVRCRSAAVFVGYWKDPERSREVLSEDGWLSTGDLAFFDEDGNLHIVGRRNDMYIRGGYNVYPLQVEAVLSDHVAVADVAVVGVDDPVLGEIGVAFVVASAGAKVETLTRQSLSEWSMRVLADYKAPDVVHVVSALPRNALGKVNRMALIEMARTLEPHDLSRADGA